MDRIHRRWYICITPRIKYHMNNNCTSVGDNLCSTFINTRTISTGYIKMAYYSSGQSHFLSVCSPFTFVYHNATTLVCEWNDRRIKYVTGLGGQSMLQDSADQVCYRTHYELITAVWYCIYFKEVFITAVYIISVDVTHFEVSQYPVTV